MTRRYLFGPVSTTFTDQNLYEERQGGNCLAFDLKAGADLTISPRDNWEAVCARLPGGWRPDFVVLYLPYRQIPACLWSAPLPVVALAADWNLLWHHYRNCLRRVDLVLTDRPGVEAMSREGILHARSANLFGLERGWQEEMKNEERRTRNEEFNSALRAPRDIDVLFVGNLDAAVQRERLGWLGRVARLGERWRVRICSGVFGEEYRKLLGRARIVFNRSIRGECNRRAFEATAAGAMLFQEAGNWEVPEFFSGQRSAISGQQECVFYDEGNLEELLEYYLEHEQERAAIAEAGRRRAREYSFANLWERALGIIELQIADLRLQIDRRRSQPSFWERTWEAVSSADATEPRLVGDLAEALVREPGAVGVQHCLGIASVHAAVGLGTPTAAALEQAAACFGRALACEPGNVMAGLNLVECLVLQGASEQAVERARGVLERSAISDQPSAIQDGPHFPLQFDLFRVEWERAAWENAGDSRAEVAAKLHLVRWRLSTILGELTGELAYYYEAAMARPDLPVTRAALGCALARAGKHAEAVPHLRYAVAGNPFDKAAARALYQVLGLTGQAVEQRRASPEGSGCWRRQCERGQGTGGRRRRRGL
jgi:tetratricopeptide (TPR) repeat protein